MLIAAGPKTGEEIRWEQVIINVQTPSCPRTWAGSLAVPCGDTWGSPKNTPEDARICWGGGFSFLIINDLGDSQIQASGWWQNVLGWRTRSGTGTVHGSHKPLRGNYITSALFFLSKVPPRNGGNPINIFPQMCWRKTWWWEGGQGSLWWVEFFDPHWEAGGRCSGLLKHPRPEPSWLSLLFICRRKWERYARN